MSMRSALLAGAALFGASAALAVPNSAPPGYPGPIPFNFTFNFDNGLQGWTIDQGAGGTGRWVPPAGPPGVGVTPTTGLLGDQVCTTANNGCKGLSGGGSVYLPEVGAAASGDEAAATINVTALNGLPSTKSFILAADVYIPRLGTPPNGTGSGQMNRPGTDIAQAGIGAARGDAREIYIEGRRASGASQGYVFFRDSAAIGYAGNGNKFPNGEPTTANPVRSLEHFWQTCGTVPGPDWWDRWVTLMIDYNMTFPGKVLAWAYIPWDGPAIDCNFTGTRTAGWFKIYEDSLDLPTSPDPNGGTGDGQANDWVKFRIGGKFSWTQAQWDNVKILLPAGCNAVAFDADGDNDVDLSDFGAFQRCYSGSNPAPGAFNIVDCSCFDRHPAIPDQDVDDSDFAQFLNCATRDGVPQTNTLCDGLAP